MSENEVTKKTSHNRSTASFETLTRIKDRLLSLEENTNRQFDAKDAAEFLRDAIQWAIDKNYRFEDIAQIITEEGWDIPKHAQKVLWNTFKQNDKRYAKAKKKKNTAAENLPEEESPKTNGTNSDMITSVAAAPDVEKEKTDITHTKTHEIHESKKTLHDTPKEHENNIAASVVNHIRSHFVIQPDTDDI